LPGDQPGRPCAEDERNQYVMGVFHVRPSDQQMRAGHIPGSDRAAGGGDRSRSLRIYLVELRSHSICRRTTNCRPRARWLESSEWRRSQCRCRSRSQAPIHNTESQTLPTWKQRPMAPNRTRLRRRTQLLEMDTQSREPRVIAVLPDTLQTD
jgi:hypothetical protein